VRRQHSNRMIKTCSLLKITTVKRLRFNRKLRVRLKLRMQMSGSGGRIRRIKRRSRRRMWARRSKRKLSNK
jgi:hypothetical protein